jgi:hypothetical protein
MATKAVDATPAGNTIVQVILPPDMVQAIDELADKARLKRGTMVRTLLAQQLDAMKAAAA